MPVSTPQEVGEVITVGLDLTKHDPNVTVVASITTANGTIAVTVDPHTMH
jgi:hypothetical protein